VEHKGHPRHDEEENEDDPYVTHLLIHRAHSNNTTTTTAASMMTGWATELRSGPKVLDAVETTIPIDVDHRQQ
jgi:hypothetical protein